MNMGSQKVAILVDSGTDLPADFVGKGRVFTAPVQYTPKIREPAVPGGASGPFSHKPERESPPAPPSASGLFTRLAEEDYEAVLIITSSSRLSSAYDELGVLASKEKRLCCRMVDTKSVSVGAGLQAILAVLEEGGGEGRADPIPAERRAQEAVSILRGYLTGGSRGGSAGSQVDFFDIWG